jgi:DeoR family fructose operon transcriptional repressor
MYSEQRKATIIELIEENGSIDVNSLSARFKISRETIRRDLSVLERQGVLKRTHGGAVLGAQSASAHAGEFPVSIRGIRQIEAKEAICKKAASCIADKDVLFVDNSSTLLYLPQFIPTRLNLTIMTNSIKFLLETAKIPGNNWLMICLGGIFNPSNLSVHGAGTMKSAEEYYPSKAFFSCAGISQRNLVADSSLHEIETKRMMIGRSQESFLLADHTKLGKDGQMFLCGFEDIDNLITDKKADRDILRYLEQADINLLFAE